MKRSKTQPSYSKKESGVFYFMGAKKGAVPILSGTIIAIFEAIDGREV